MFSRYGFWGCCKLLFSYIRTRIFYGKSRLIRFPFDIRNRKYIDLGKGLTTGYGCRIEAHPVDKTSGCCVVFGKDVEINDYVHIGGGESVIIGDNVLIASKVFISDINHGNYKGIDQDSPLIRPNKRRLSTKPVLIKDNVWIGEGVCIMAGVTIGYGCIIGALSVVTKDIPDYTIAVGSPAQVVKTFNFDSDEWGSI